MKNKSYPRRRSPRIYSIQYDNSPEIEKKENKRSNPTGRAHNFTNANTDTPRTHVLRRRPFCAHTYKNSCAEAELGSLFLKVKEVHTIQMTLAELGHPQPPTPIHCGIATTSGIAIGTIKKQRS